MVGLIGYGFIVQIGDFVSCQKVGKIFFVLDDGEVLLLVFVLGDVVVLQFGVFSIQGWLLSFLFDEFKYQFKGGKGLMLMDLEVKDCVVLLVCFIMQLCVYGSGCGGKFCEEVLKNQFFVVYVGKCVCKGKVVEGLQRVVCFVFD